MADHRRFAFKFFRRLFIEVPYTSIRKSLALKFIEHPKLTIAKLSFSNYLTFGEVSQHTSYPTIVDFNIFIENCTTKKYV